MICRHRLVAYRCFVGFDSSPVAFVEVEIVLVERLWLGWQTCAFELAAPWPELRSFLYVDVVLQEVLIVLVVEHEVHQSGPVSYPIRW